MMNPLLNNESQHLHKRILTEMMGPIKDEHSRANDVTPKTSPGNARVTDEHKVAIQYLQ